MEKRSNYGFKTHVEKEKKHSSVSMRIRKYLIGATLVIAGVLLILGRTGIMPSVYMHYIFSWQMLLIVIGLIGLLSRSSSYFVSLLLILIGGFFLATELYDIPIETKRLFWPIILVIAGLLIIFKHKNHEKWNKRFKTGEQIPSGVFKRDYVFGGGKNFITSKDFAGGAVSVVFGGCELDFTEAELAEGTNILEINAIFGGIEIKVPRHWEVEVDVSGILGGFSDERRYYNSDNIDSSRKLIIKGSAIFGGGDIKNL
jgi:predicted membrane protein